MFELGSDTDVWHVGANFPVPDLRQSGLPGHMRHMQHAVIRSQISPQSTTCIQRRSGGTSIVMQEPQEK